MRIIAILTAMALAAILLFPPADNVVREVRGTRTGEYETFGQPEYRIGWGFIFIGEVGGQVKIRYDELAMEVIGLFLVSGLSWLASKGRKVTANDLRKAFLPIPESHPDYGMSAIRHSNSQTPK